MAQQLRLHVDERGVIKAIKDKPGNFLGQDKRGRPHWRKPEKQSGGGKSGGAGGASGGGEGDDGDYTIQERKSRGMLGRGPEKTIYTVIHGGKAVKEFNSREDAEDYRKYIIEYDARERRRGHGEQGPGEIA